MVRSGSTEGCCQARQRDSKEGAGGGLPEEVGTDGAGAPWWCILELLLSRWGLGANNSPSQRLHPLCPLPHMLVDSMQNDFLCGCIKHP